MKITNHLELRQRTAIKCNSKQITDQSHLKRCDINAIMANYKKTGLLSHQKENIAQYIDNTQIPSLMDAQKLLRDAKESFLALPSQIRKLMDNDPAQLVQFLQDPENKDILIKHGVLEEKKISTEVDPIRSDDPPSVDKKEIKED